MKSSSISVSNAMILSQKEWIITLALVLLINGFIYYGWGSWEAFNPGPDYRETCWAEKMSDYWGYTRWIRYAKEHYRVLLIGDSVVWGQEVRNNETISHFLNECYGRGGKVANIGNDGLNMAAIDGIVSHYGEDMDNANFIVQLNPLGMRSLRSDLRGDRKSMYRYYHPRLIPQFSPRITYNHDLNTRIGYFIEHYVRMFPFVRHLMANYYDNKSISSWMMNNPYRNPFTAITFESSPVMAESQGKSLDWETKKQKVTDETFVDPRESIQWGCFTDAMHKLKKKNSRVFVMIGPFNTYMLTPGSRLRLYTMVEILKKDLDALDIPYFDTLTIGLPSRLFADNCHLLKDGHIMLAKAMLGDERFSQWLSESVK